MATAARRALVSLALARSFAPRPARRSFTSRSARDTPAEADVAAGAPDRRARLEAELRSLGFDAETLETDERLRGSSALAAARSFIVPKTYKGLADATVPARAAIVARDVVGLARKHIANQTEWLRNRDRELAERPPAPHADLTIVLDGLRSGENVGSVLRTADAAGLAEIVVCGSTPAPPTPAVLKSAMGAADYVSVKRVPSALDAVEALQARGVAVWACETTERSIDLHAAGPPPRPLALVFGHEEFGVSADVMAASDAIIEIPVFG
eukprot:CAMPEP_0119289860 /NCGR_PEP_ID=MMETSP1329-20130426/39730_1 /TAXON_ID=114041 /ORGANISM="Genus nov. species nov., Strain RCC1024" /LENGTH=268 /DNA_ID=CAMNT_0007290673 /DNA_START=91 /DNA_END=894 /DNA_ORIENTATION=-